MRSVIYLVCHPPQTLLISLAIHIISIFPIETDFYAPNKKIFTHKLLFGKLSNQMHLLFRHVSHVTVHSSLRERWKLSSAAYDPSSASNFAEITDKEMGVSDKVLMRKYSSTHQMTTYSSALTVTRTASNKPRHEHSGGPSNSGQTWRQPPWPARMVSVSPKGGQRLCKCHEGN